MTKEILTELKKDCEDYARIARRQEDQCEYDIGFVRAITLIICLIDKYLERIKPDE